MNARLTIKVAAISAIENIRKAAKVSSTAVGAPFAAEPADNWKSHLPGFGLKAAAVLSSEQKGPRQQGGAI